MNIEETKKAIKVMQAYVDGVEIERCYRWEGHPWKSSSNPTWAFTAQQYRIKPKPREFWVDPGHSLSSPEYRRANAETNLNHYIKVLEVL